MSRLASYKPENYTQGRDCGKCLLPSFFQNKLSHRLFENARLKETDICIMPAFSSKETALSQHCTTIKIM